MALPAVNEPSELTAMGAIGRDVLDAEMALLGVLLREPALTVDVARTLSPEDFWGAEFNQSPNGRIFAALCEDAQRGATTEPHALVLKLAEALVDVGGGRYVGDLIEKAGASSVLPELVRQLATSAAQRRLMRSLARPDLRPDELANLLEAEVRRTDGLAVRVRPIKATPFEWQDPATVPRREWLYDLHMIRRFVSATFAPGAVGKTMLLIVEALAMATGRPLLGTKPREPLTVWLINLEDPREEIQRRVLAACEHYEIRPEDLVGRLYFDSGRDVEVMIAKSTGRGIDICAPCVRQIEREIVERGIDVLVVDPFVACHEVEENNNGAINAVVKQWAGIADRTGCAVELVHHVKKAANGQAETTVEDGRGASALLAGVRSARVLNRMTEAQATEWGIEQPRLYFRVDNGKANLAPPAGAAKWRKLEDVDLCNGPAGFSDRVGVPVAWEPPRALDGFSARDLRAVQEKVASGNYRDDPQAPDWVGKVVAEVMGWKPAGPDGALDAHQKARIKRVQQAWKKSGALAVERRKTSNRKMRPFTVVGEWVTP